MKKKQYIYGISAILMWSTLATVVKLVMTEIPNLEALSISSLIAFFFLVITNTINGKIKEFRKYSINEIAIMVFLGFIGLFMYSALYYQGIAMLSSQEACVLNYLWPIMIVLFSSIILKEKLTLAKLLAMICSFIGTIILVSGGSNNTSENKAPGVICCILAAALYGLFSVLNKKADYNQNIAMTVIWLTTAIFSGVLGIITEKWVYIYAKEWIGIIWLGIFVDAVAYLLWAIALRTSKNTAEVANLAYLTPFMSVVISALVLDEKLNVRTILALVFIVGGILIQNIYELKRQSIDNNV